MNFRCLVNKVISSITRSIGKVGYRAGNFWGELFWRLEKDPLVIVFIDGGMCSQIERATLGKQFEEKGFKVKYQLDFYRLQGYDMYHVERRDYILDRCFPDVRIDVATPEEIKKYRILYDYESGQHGRIDSIDELDRRKPIFLSGYSSDHLMDYHRSPDFFDIDSVKPLLGSNALGYYQKISENKKLGILNIGVHVRRGDMVNTGFYWKVLTGKYFIEAIERLKIESGDRQICLFFFSNGFDFVRTEILPHIAEDSYVLVEGNEREYEDFYLLCKCDYQVKSQGGWGRVAYLFNNNPDKRLITYDPSCNYDDGCIVMDLTDDMYEH